MSKDWKALIKKAKSKTPWTFLNEELYQLCERRPLHKEVDVIIAKVCLIGRSYSAAIERKRMSTSPGGGFYEQVVGPTIKGSDIDQWIGSVAAAPSSAAGSIEAILNTHYRLMGLFNKISGTDKRSLASKYLHFHRPQCFYIFDSRAVAGMRHLAVSVGSLRATSYKNVDSKYSGFVQRCTHLTSWIKQNFNVELSPRQIDNLLLEVSSARKNSG